MRWENFLRVLAAGVLVAACDRNVVAFDPNEEPRQPDLSRIFPEGAKQRSEAGPPAAIASARGGEAQEGAAKTVRGRVSVAPEFASRVPAGAVLFIIARRAAVGPPLAVKRVRDPRLPLEFSLGPEDRMIQTMPFEGPLQLSARLDGDGNAMSREPGDLLGALPGPVEPGDQGVEIVIDRSL